MQAISLLVVSEATGFDETSDVQDELAQTGIKIQFVLLPILTIAFGYLQISRRFEIMNEDD